MTWFKVDDTAHANPKMLRAGNAALGLWVRAGAYAAQHLTEGTVPGVVAQLYGTAPQARKLVAAGLWHAHDHACNRCPQPAPGDYVMHDFLTYNPTRAKVEDKRQKEADRQARGRARAAEQRTGQSEKRSESSSKTGRFADDSPTGKGESDPIQHGFWDGAAGQEGVSHRDGTDPYGVSRPDPTPLLPTGVEQASYAREDSTHAVPVNVRPLRDALTAAGIVVEWNLAPADWFRLEAIVKRTAVAALVEHARGAAQRARSRPQSVRYFLPGWTALPPVPEGAPTSPSADVIPIAAARPGRVHRAADMFRTAALDTPQETAQ
ncbi:mucin-2 [Streptomyces nigrescens]|uniref:mucin-2 n=1 Tax=Streptomyces nigrescens TaxID=1920 RepID=UPI00369FE2A3